MNRKAIAVAAIGLALLSCGEASRQRSIQGILVGADGEVPPLAHVHLLALGDGFRARIESAEIGANGEFMLVLPDDAPYDLLVTAVNHRPFRVPLVSDDPFMLTGVRITPQPYLYADALEGVRVIGDWADFSWHESEPMTLQDDGTFTYERETEADTLAYQLLGVEQSGRSINGTDSDYYIYDGGGDYISVVNAEDGTARVSFDPQESRIKTTRDLPMVDFGDGGDGLAEVWEIRKRWLDEIARGDRLYAEHMEEEGTGEGFEYDMSALKQYLMAKIARGGQPASKRYAAITMAGIPERGLPLEDQEAMAIVEAVPVTDRMWTAQPIAFPEVFRQAYGQDKMVELFEQNLGEIADDRVRAAMLLEVGLAAKAEGDSVRQRRIYEDLTGNYADLDVPYISYRIETQLDPDLRVTAGKPVPDFELALLDNQGTVSRQSMLGKYYLIDFWATWCGPCIGEMPHLHKVYEEFADRGLEIVSVSLDQSVEDIERFRETNWNMPWLHSFAEGMFTSEIPELFEVSGIPKPVLVGPDGIIIAAGPSLRGAKLEQVLEKHLGD